MLRSMKNASKRDRIGSWRWRWCAPWALALFAGCSSSDAQTPAPGPTGPVGTGRAVLGPDTRVLDEPSLGALANVTPEGEYFFSTTTPLLAGVREGNILVGAIAPALPHGALVRVESVTPRDGGLAFGTRPAALEEAFEELTVHLAGTITDPTAPRDTRPTHLAPGVARVSQALGVTLPIAFSASSGQNRIAMNGSLAVDPSIDVVVDIDITEFALKELSVSLGAKETFLAEFTGTGKVPIDKSIKLNEVWFTPITIPLGPVPLVITPRLVVEASLKGSIQGEIQANVRQEAGFSAGVGFRDGAFKGFSDADTKFDVEQPTYEASVNLKAAAGPRLDVLLYGAVGAFAGVEAYVELSASAEGPPPCAAGVLDAGLAAKVGVDFLKKYSSTLFDKRFPLAKFDSCTNDPNAPRPATTWARAFSRAGSSDDHAKAVVQAADGSYLVVGNSALFGGVTGFGAAVWAMRLDALGNVVWQRAFQRITQLGLVQGAEVVPDGFLVVGTAGVLKLDSGGNPVWAKTYKAGSATEIASVAASPDGSFLVAGSTNVDNSAWAMRLDPLGNVVWSRRYAGPEFTRVRGTRDGGAVLLGRVESAFGDLHVVKLDPSGNVQWARAIDNRFDTTGGTGEEPQLQSSIDRGYDIAEKPAGGYVIAGQSYGNFPVPEPDPAGYSAPVIYEIAADGSLTDCTIHRAPAAARYGGAYAVGVRSNGSHLVVGNRADDVGDLLEREDLLLIQGSAYSAIGGPKRDGIYTGTLAGLSYGAPLRITGDDGAIVAATSNSFGDGNQFWVLKLNRTAGIQLPTRSSLAGSSYKNNDAVSSALSGAFTDHPATATSFLEAVASESTAIVVVPQTP